jgi:coxsackievirus/adenovirus receptor
MCDGRTDEDEGLTAGQCHCKTYVGSIRCDRCLNGFWNFTLDNPDGCQGELTTVGYIHTYKPPFFRS